ncbi:hypothetical protein PX701_02215 [Agromyces sp. H3Y2-19a]|uniref:hypothetical protein n=1 Tax=Agromyces chromiiresistens TaxID=3030835 RepID=UPI0023B896E5|nr:hypothetical protein [Agromyces chromiiresistens]MDF0512427.1 hypothetical protein [Agromyces chromiiresistens]
MSISRPIATALAAAGLAGVLVFGLSACSPGPGPKPSPTPTASAEPIFASDEEALAAAVKAYEAYDKVSDSIINDGGADPERIDAVVTARYAPQLRDEFVAIAEAGLRSSGVATVDSVSLVSNAERDGLATVSIYFCRDLSDARVLDKTGADVTPEGREERVPSQGFFVSDAPGSQTLLVDEVTRWSGENFC